MTDINDVEYSPLPPDEDGFEPLAVYDDQPPLAVKRYIVFAGDCYYPLGGWKDLLDSFDDKGEAIASADADLNPGYTWAQVVDLHTGKIIHGYGEGDQ